MSPWIGKRERKEENRRRRRNEKRCHLGGAGAGAWRRKGGKPLHPSPLLARQKETREHKTIHAHKHREAKLRIRFGF